MISAFPYLQACLNLDIRDVQVTSDFAFTPSSGVSTTFTSDSGGFIEAALQGASSFLETAFKDVLKDIAPVISGAIQSAVHQLSKEKFATHICI